MRAAEGFQVSRVCGEGLRWWRGGEGAGDGGGRAGVQGPATTIHYIAGRRVMHYAITYLTWRSGEREQRGVRKGEG